MSALRELMDEALALNDPARRGDELCVLVDEMLGHNQEQTGYMMHKEAVALLQKLANALAKTSVDDAALETAKKKKFESYASMAQEKVDHVQAANQNVNNIRKAVRASHGSFLAGNFT